MIIMMPRSLFIQRLRELHHSLKKISNKKGYVTIRIDCLIVDILKLVNLPAQTVEGKHGIHIGEDVI